MEHPIQHPWVIIGTIVAVLSLGSIGVAGYSDIKSDIAVTQANITANGDLDKQRYASLNGDVIEIKTDTRYIREMVDRLQLLGYQQHREGN